MVLLGVNFLPGDLGALGLGETTADTLVNVNVEIIGKNTGFVRAYNKYMRAVAKAIDACF